MTTRPDLTAELPSLSKRDAAELLRRSDIVRLLPGTPIVTGGSLPRWAYVVLEGDTLEWGPAGMQILRAGQVFPTQVLSHDRSRVDCSVTAVTAVTVLAMGIREFWGAVDELPTFAALVDRLTLTGR